MENISEKGINKLLVRIITAEMLGIICSLVTKNFGNYELLIKPPLSPPMYAFPVMWTVVFFLAGLASYLVSVAATKEKSGLLDDALFFYKAMLCVSLLWTVFFFGIKFILVSSVWMVLLIYIVIVTAYKFKAINVKAGILLIPFLFWSIFAAYVNIGIWYLTVFKTA